MNVSFDWYNVFYYVGEFKNVTKAANFLCVSQPAITKNIRNLEEALGKKLINKTTKGIELTEDGKILYNEIKEPIEKLNTTLATFRKRSNEYDKEICISAGFSTTRSYILKLLAEFNKKYPKIKFKLCSDDYDVALQRLREGKCDLIFFDTQEVKETYNNIITEKWITVDDMLVVSSKVKDKYPDYIKLKDLNNYPIICKLGGGTGRKNLENEFKKCGVKFLPTYQLSHNYLVEEYVKLGIGIGLVVNNLVKKELNNKELVPIKTDFKLPKRLYAFSYRKDSDKYQIIKEFADSLKNITE